MRVGQSQMHSEKAVVAVDTIASDGMLKAGGLFNSLLADR